jgi:uncharacterized protein (TIRG00374 family)
LKSLNARSPDEQRRPVERLKQAVGYLFALGGLAWVLYDVHPRQLAAHLTIRDWRWAGAAIVADILAFMNQGWRWSLLLSPLGKISIFRATQAIYAGLFTNEVLPLRAGELLRAFLVSRWLPAPFGRVIGSIAVERLLDGIALALCLGTAAVFVPLPHSIAETADVFGAVIIASAFALGYFVYRYSRRPVMQPEPAGRVRSFLHSFLSGSHSIVTSGHLWPASAISFLVLGFQSLAFWLMMPACGLKLPLWIGAVVFFIVHLGTAVPNAPANAGSYQFFTALGLTLFGIDKPAAAGFSIVVFFVLTIPLWIIGFLALTASGMNLGRVRQEISALRANSNRC